MKCEVIRDLLPSYIGQLTSDETNKLVEAHLRACEACNEVYQDMKQDIPEPSHKIGPPSDKNERKIVKRIRSKLLTVAATLVITFTILGFVLGVFGNVLFQEGNPIPVISSIMELEFTDAAYAEISSTPVRYISELKPGEDRYNVVNSYMEERGWSLTDQMGSAFVFTKDNEQMIIGTRQFTRHYFIWTIPEQETRQKIG